MCLFDISKQTARCRDCQRHVVTAETCQRCDAELLPKESLRSRYVKRGRGNGGHGSLSRSQEKPDASGVIIRNQHFSWFDAQQFVSETVFPRGRYFHDLEFGRGKVQPR